MKRGPRAALPVRRFTGGVAASESGTRLDVWLSARLPDLSDADRAIVDKLAIRLVNRLLHGPTERLRSLPKGTRTEIVQQIVVGLQGGPG